MKNKMINRVILIVLDSVGIGELPDADKFNDCGSNTLCNTSKAVNGLKIPNLTALGLGNIDGAVSLSNSEYCDGIYGKLGELSNGKDSTIGHWEMAGILSKQPFPVYPKGFPKEIIDQFINDNQLSGILGNYPASGTKIIEELGEEHIRTGKPIIYTSGDSVFQIAAHEDVIPLDKLYEMCRSARSILQGKNAVARVIARPFIGVKGAYIRTSNRRDFSLKPSEDNVLCYLKKAGYDVIGVGKIEDLFAGVGLTEVKHTKDNQDGIDVTIDYIKKDNRGLIFTNLVEFDSKWGHRNDYCGYAKGLEDFDKRLPEIYSAMKPDDVLMITADHGCDPTTVSTDHSREYVPLLIKGNMLKNDINLHTGKSIANVGATIADIFGCQMPKIGDSYLSLILN